MDNELMKVGDTVIWRGSWGQDAPLLARVDSIEKTLYPRQKHGNPVTEIPWAEKSNSVVTLDNGSWAYGFQLCPV